MDSRRPVRYPDSHQLFVGNLPHDIDENELKEFFMSKEAEARFKLWDLVADSLDILGDSPALADMSVCAPPSHRLWERCRAADQHQGSWWQAAQFRVCGLRRL